MTKAVLYYFEDKWVARDSGAEERLQTGQKLPSH